ncbi:MAG: hypothetical protein IPI06_15090 [Gammaproteobacteria bacterium]|nr:hypothetical protein [Gammaproteobacteria bacterium]
MAMDSPPPGRLPQPLYESLPALYLLAGAVALGVSRWIGPGWLAWLVSLIGVAGVLGGLVVWLRRRDYRRMQARYGGGSLPD